MDTNTGQSPAGTTTPDPVRPSHESGRSSIPVGDWKINFRGHTWTAHDVNTAHAVTVSELLNGTGWDSVDPRTGPRQLATWIIVLLAAATGRPIEETMPEVFALSIPDLIATLE